MHNAVVKLLVATALCLTMAACVPDPALIEAGIVEPPAPKVQEGVYIASSDNGFTVPAVPVEKVPAEFQRQSVYYETDQPIGTIIINPAAKHLYLVTARNMAMRYGIAVGRDGFQWSGEALITGRNNWPTWTPPPEMIERKPELSKWEKGQPGGPDNPLGARALYLTTNGVDYGYRIHGTPEWFSIGKSASSGCIRMINQDVMDLFNRVPDGTKVIVLKADGSLPTGLTLPPPQPKKPKPAVTKAKAVTTPSVTTPAVMGPVGTTPVVTPAVVGPVIAKPVAATTPTVLPLTPSVTKPATVVTPVVPKPATPAVTTPAVTTPAKPAVICTVPLVNGVCPILPLPKTP